jgi:hypothetical protein
LAQSSNGFEESNTKYACVKGLYYVYSTTDSCRNKPQIRDSITSCEEDGKEKDGDGEDRHLHSLVVVESNLLVLLFLKFHLDPDLFPEIFNGFVEFPINTLRYTGNEIKPEFVFHSRQIVTNRFLSDNPIHPRDA